MLLFAAGTWQSLAFAPHWKTKSKTPASAPKEKLIEFNRDVRPVLSKCFTCHGHDEHQIKAGLRLDRREGAIKKLGNGEFAIVPFHPEKSELVNRIFSKDESDLMPPKVSNKVLTLEEKNVLKQWILEGAEYKPHWGFVAPVRPPVPAVKHTSWPKQPIDNFVLARLEKMGLTPSPEADRRTLIRRVTLDLTGLPPTTTEVNNFLADHSPKAYEKLVDRLLASPSYGERMAMDWMDYSRYADSNGYQADFERFQWRWRDWVIDSFNKNKPYDQFTIEQLAGDMLPNATMEQKLATGFNRNHRINTEGGVVPEEWRVETVIDRVETTSAVWLGLTSGCARCHDHKYDPISQKEFYGLYSIFNNVPESGTGEERPVNHPPVMRAPTPDQSTRLAALTQRVESLDRLEKQQLAAAPAIPSDWKASDPSEKLASMQNGLEGRYRLTNPPSVRTGNVPAPKIVEKPEFGSGRSTGAVTVTDKSFLDLGNVGDFDTKDSFSYGAWLSPNENGGSAMARMDSMKDYQGWDLMLSDTRPTVHLISKWPDDAIKVISRTSIPLKQWSHVLVTYDGSAKPEGIKIYVNGRLTETDVEKSMLKGSIRNGVTARLGRRTDDSVYKGQIDDPVLYHRALLPEEVRALSSVNASAPLLAIPPEKRTAEQNLQITRLYLLDRDAGFKNLDDDLLAANDERDKLNGTITDVMVMEEMAKPRPTFVLVRGQYDKPGAKVQAGFPAALKIAGKSFPATRLGLAKWIVDPKNPLTGRVTVNRLWERFFGTGLVATSEDFGTRADYPTHPELLDWMATEIIRLKWDMKAMIREIVTSATYRQSSVTTPTLQRVDPTNKWLARGPRFRLPAEVIRDQAMWSGGLLTQKIGGPSVRPYQPAGVWDELNVYGNLRNYKHDMGANLHRRSLYTIWKRTAAPPNMVLFDVPSRETCRIRRSRTNTPLQALALLNDETYVEAARSLAQRMLLEGGKTPESRLNFAFETLLARAPSREETRILESGLQKRLEHYRQNPESAKKLTMIGDAPVDKSLNPVDLAAYTVTASTILNLDESLTKE